MALSAKISALAGKLAGLRGRYGDFGILAFANFRCDAQFGNRQAVGHIGAAKDQSYRLPAFQRDLRRAIGETAGDNVDFPLFAGPNRGSGAQKPCDCGEYVFHHRRVSPNGLFYGARYSRISFSSSALSIARTRICRTTARASRGEMASGALWHRPQLVRNRLSPSEAFDRAGLVCAFGLSAKGEKTSIHRKAASAMRSRLTWLLPATGETRNGR